MIWYIIGYLLIGFIVTWIIIYTYQVKFNQNIWLQSDDFYLMSILFWPLTGSLFISIILENLIKKFFK